MDKKQTHNFKGLILVLYVHTHKNTYMCEDQLKYMEFLKKKLFETQLTTTAQWEDLLGAAPVSVGSAQGNAQARVK